jgi:outer membrane protein assembly factor BamB
MKSTCAVLLLCCLCGIAAPGVDDWPMLQHDLQHTGFSSSRVPTHLREVWMHKECEGPEARIVISEGKLFVTGSYIIYALDTEDGSLIWSYELERKWMRLLAPPVVADNRVYTGAPTTILCLDATRGTLLWNYDVDPIILHSAPIVIGSYFVMGCGGLPLEPGLKDSRRLLCLNAQTGELIWDFYMNDAASYSPAYYEGQIFVDDGYKDIYCLDLETGALIWKIERNSVSSSGITLDGERIFLGDQTGIACLELQTGDLIWHFDCGNGLGENPAIGNGRLFFGCSDGVFYCLDAEKGELLWKIESEKRTACPPIIADNKVVFGNVDGMLYIVDSKSGKICETADFGVNGVMSLAISDGRLYVGQDDGTIICFEEPPFRKEVFILSAAALALIFIVVFWYRRRI